MDDNFENEGIHFEPYSRPKEKKTKEQEAEHESKFQVGQTVKSETHGIKGVIIKITPNASAIDTDMYTIKTSDEKRLYLAESSLELDETVVTTLINGVETDVVIGPVVKESDLEPQFKAGDYVQYHYGGERLKIIQFLGNNDADGHPLYEAVADDGEIQHVSETLLEPYTGRKYTGPKIIDIPPEDVGSITPVDKEAEIKAKTEDILKFLNIKSSNDYMMQLENAMKIHKYICQNLTYTPSVMQEKKESEVEDILLDELYNGLINKRGVCTTDAIMFKHLLSQIEMHGDVVILKSKEGGAHAATLVQLGDESYYFDTTLERTIFEEQSNDPERFVFRCAGLGQQEYDKYYTPIGVLQENLNEDEDLLPMPDNISQESVPKIIIHNIGNGMQNLTFDESSLDEELDSISVSIEHKDKAADILSKEHSHLRVVSNKFKEEEL